MKRVSALAAAVVLAAVTILVLTERDAAPNAVTRQGRVPPKTDSVWYHASNVALLAKTGRPQFVEFFHPD